jgi:hypothetical protein
MINSEATVHVTKIAAAKRQLDTAIRMYFACDDELSIHTLVAAAFRILRDVIQSRGMNYGQEVVRAGLCAIAKEYGQGTLSEDVLKTIKESGLLHLFETILAEIREHGDKFVQSRIQITDPIKAEQRAWPSAPANFLKHADRDADALLAAGDVNNEVFLMGACAAYLELMRTPSPEIMAFIALWAAEHEAAPDVHEPARKLANKLVSLKTKDERYHACAEWVRQRKD